jgi:hypothetical protein
LTPGAARRHIGIDAAASPEQVRAAWRLWARMAHPDHGGDPAQFRLLCQARDVLLHSASAKPSHQHAAPPNQHAWAPAHRRNWREITRRPTRRAAVLASALISLGLLLALLPQIFPGAPLVLSAAPAALGAAGVALYLRDQILVVTADVGHRIVGVTLIWLPLATGQVVLAETVGVSLLTVLPLLALPLVAVVAAQNPGAGLRRHPMR